MRVLAYDTHENVKRLVYRAEIYGIRMSNVSSEGPIHTLTKALPDEDLLGSVYMEERGPALLVGLALVRGLDFTSRLHGKSQPSYPGWLAYSQVTLKCVYMENFQPC